MIRVTVVSIAVAITLLVSASAHPLDITRIDIHYKCSRIDDVIQDYGFEIVVEGTDINDIVFHDATLGLVYPMTLDPDTGNFVHEEDGFGTWLALNAVHAIDNVFTFYFNEQVAALPLDSANYQDAINILVSVRSPGVHPNQAGVHPIITSPLHLALDVAVPVEIVWDSLSGTPGLHALGVFVENHLGDEVYSNHYWPDQVQSGPIPLADGPTYTADVVAFGIQGGGPQVLQTLNSDSLTYWGSWDEENSVIFSTGPEIVPEPMSLLLVGTGALTLLALHRRRKIV